MVNLPKGLIHSWPINSIENKFVNIEVKCECVLCSPNFVEESEGRKTYDYVILLGSISCNKRGSIKKSPTKLICSGK